MPRPVFMICSEMASENKKDNQLSIFGVIEMLTLQIAAKEGATVPPPERSIKSRIIAAWLKEEADEGVEFEEQVVFHLPGATDEVVAAEQRFRFDDEMCIHRISLQMLGWPPMATPGLFRIECRVRPVGEEHWMSQEYPIVIEVVHIPPDSGESDDGDKTSEGNQAVSETS